MEVGVAGMLNFCGGQINVLLGSAHAVRAKLDRHPRPSAQLRTRRVTTTECGFAISRYELPEVCISFAHLKIRGRREGRVRAAPAVSCAIMRNKHAHEHTGTAGASRPSLRDGFTAYFVLFPENGFFASVVSGTFPPA